MNIWDNLLRTQNRTVKTVERTSTVTVSSIPPWGEVPDEFDEPEEAKEQYLPSLVHAAIEGGEVSPLPGLDSEDDQNIKDAVFPTVAGQEDARVAPGVKINYSSFPTGSMVLGWCEDGLPMVLDLNDPSPGAVLLTGEWNAGIGDVFQLLLMSAIKINLPRFFRFGILSSSPERWEGWIPDEEKRRNIGITHLHLAEAEWMILKLAERGRAISLGLQLPRINLIIIDDLEEVDHFSFETRLSLEWLLREGANLGIWIFSYCDPQKLFKNSKLQHSFKTRILGHVQDMNQARQLAHHLHLPQGTWPDKGTFVAKMGTEILRFSVLNE
jgi:hypothetical protein